MKSFSLVILTSLLVSPVAFAQSVENQVKDALQTAETGLYDLIDKDMTTVNFTRGGSSLSEAEMRNIRAVYKSVLADTAVEKVVVAAWADRDGLKKDAKLPDGQIALAQKRAESIRRVLSEMTNKPVETYNMAQDAGWIAKTFRTKDARVKGAMTSPAAADEGARSLAATLEAKGGLSKAVVIVKRINQENATTGR